MNEKLTIIEVLTALGIIGGSVAILVLFVWMIS